MRRSADYCARQDKMPQIPRLFSKIADHQLTAFDDVNSAYHVIGNQMQMQFAPLLADRTTSFWQNAPRLYTSNCHA